MCIQNFLLKNYSLAICLPSPKQAPSRLAVNQDILPVNAQRNPKDCTKNTQRNTFSVPYLSRTN